MKANRGSKLSVQQRIANFLLAYRSTRHATTGRTPASLFRGRELRNEINPSSPECRGEGDGFTSEAESNPRRTRQV